MIKAVLFDLDGTLLPMNQDLFIREYYSGLASKLAPNGYNAEELIHSLTASVIAMIKNDGNETNETVFWNKFSELVGEDIKNHIDVFDDFYRNEFQGVKEVCGYNEKSKKIIKKCKENGLRVILATSPLFPRIGTESRIRWAGLSTDDFEFFTTYEDYKFCKPSLGYYQEVLDRAGLKAEECLMVGNDTTDDMGVRKLGMKVFLVTDCLINQRGFDINDFPHGGFDELETFIDNVNN